LACFSNRGWKFPKIKQNKIEIENKIENQKSKKKYAHFFLKPHSSSIPTHTPPLAYFVDINHSSNVFIRHYHYLRLKRPHLSFPKHFVRIGVLSAI
jgi:hypothetical protein